jgi:hypothetical protein
MTKFLETLRSFPMGFNRVSDAVPSTPERAAEGRQASPLPFIRKAFLAAVAVLTAADNADAGVFEKQTSSIRYFNNGHVSLKSDLPGHGVFHIKFPNDEGQKFHFPLMKSRRVEILREYHWATPQAAQVYYCNEGLNITDIRNVHTYIPKPNSFTTRFAREEQPSVHFQEEALLPPGPTLTNDLIRYHYINGLRTPVHMTNEEWGEIEAEAKRKTEEAYAKWEDGLRKCNIRIHGNAETPRGYRMIVTQRVVDDVERHAYIIDPESGSIWREK